MSNPVSLTTTHVLFANLAKNIALLTILVIVSRVYGEKEFGIFTLSLAITTPFFAFALIGARILKLTVVENIDTRSIEKTLVITGTIALVISVFFTLFFSPEQANSQTFDLLLFAVFSVSIYKWGDLFTEVHAGELQIIEQTRKLLFVSILSALIVVLVSGTIAVLELDFRILLLGISFSGLAGAFVFWVATFQIRFSSDSKIKMVLKLGIPLGIASAIGTLVSTTPQYFIAVFWGAEFVGELAILLYLFAFADLFGGAYSQAWLPKIKTIKDKKSLLNECLKIGVYSTLVMIPTSVVLALGFSYVVPLVFGSAYNIQIDELIPLALSIALLPFVHMLAIALFTQKAYKENLQVTLMSALAVLLASILFVEPFGISGALWALVVGLLVKAFLPLQIIQSLREK